MDNLVRLAKRLIIKSTHHQHHHACLIFKKSRLISTGYNQLKTHTKSLHPFKSLHAETHAIINAGDIDLKGCTAFIYRERRDGTMGNSRCCPSCEESLRTVGITDIIYSTEDGLISEAI